MAKTSHQLTADPHLLRLLGDELIGNDRLAIFELVKNSYDADATLVEVELNLGSTDPCIRIRDNGNGMTAKVLVGSWMRLGTGHKRGPSKQRSLIFKRLPLGEKGVGRLAVQKLGGITRLVTRVAGGPEYEVCVDWNQLIENAEELTDLSFTVEERRSPEEFPEDQHGTLIEISSLYRKDWTRRDLRALKKLLVGLKTPFDTVSDFDVQLTVPGRELEIYDVLDISDILNRAVWSYKFSLRDDGSLDWDYHFTPPAPLAKKLHSRALSSKKPEDRRLLGIKLNQEEESIRSSNDRESLYITPADLRGIGPIAGHLFLYDRRRESFGEGTFKQMRQYLDEQTGVRVYRDGIRVFNYGEPGDDWLMLNARRINTPVGRTGSNSVIGGIGINLDRSFGLKEKTNREGFDENSTFLRFRWIVQSLVDHLDRLRREDRELLDQVVAGRDTPAAPQQKKPFDVVISELREATSRHGLKDTFDKHLDWIEHEYNEMRQVLASGAGGQHLALVIHEIEREVNLLRKAIDSGESPQKLKERASHVVGVLDAVSGLLRQSPRKKTTAKQLLEKVTALNQVRFRYHKISVSCPVLTGEDQDFDLVGPLNLYMAALNNLVDNAMFWARSRAQIEDMFDQPALAIRVFPAWFPDGSSAIVVADNGPGFSLSQEDARRPFVTTKPGGMGLGLYYSSLVMESTGGELFISDAEEFDLPRSYKGAVVVLKFKKA